MTTSVGGRTSRALASRLSVIVSGALALSLGVALLAPATATAPAPGPGSRGIGDSYFPLDGNGGIDVQHYDVRNRYNFRTGELKGRTVLTLRPTQDLTRFNLDLLLTPTEVKIDGKRVRFRKDGKHELVITPNGTLRQGSTVKVVVRHRGKPAKISYRGQKNFLSNRHEAVTVNEPHMAPWWFAANDHPTDKATFAVAVTVPKGKQVISNGTLRKKVNRGKHVTWHWAARDPMTTYLAFFAAGDYRIERGTTQGLPWLIAVSERLTAKQQERALKVLRKSARIARQLEKYLGPYPFETTGGISIGFDTEFALENQTRPIYWPLRAAHLDVVVHEQVHQWLGDWVAVKRWRDIWINEGLTSFMEYRWAEDRGRSFGGQEMLTGFHQLWPASDPIWKVKIGDPGPDDLFHASVYLRGAMTVQALRNRIGEKAFATLLRTWVERNAGGNASGADFEALAEQISGQELTRFFDVWLRTAKKPQGTEANGFVKGS